MPSAFSLGNLYACMNDDWGHDTYGWNTTVAVYKDHAGDAQWLMKEALRRAVDIRGSRHQRRDTNSVDVLNMLSDALGTTPTRNSGSVGLVAGSGQNGCGLRRSSQRRVECL